MSWGVMTTKSESDSEAWVADLVHWFDRNQRSMPWRDDPSPYKVWISEIMLQQTQVATVIPYFDRFVRRFPDVESLARADIQDVLRLWEGLGYYTRARNLHKAARLLTARGNGLLPSRSEELLQLPGIGLYTAAAIASIAFGEHVPVVDGNVLRVFCRFWGIRTPLRDPSVARTIRSRLLGLIQNAPPSRFNQAIMELGATICIYRKPLCTKCLLSAQCTAFNRGLTTSLPVSRPAVKIPHHRLAAAVIWRKGRVLLAQRRESGMLAGLWEFPEAIRQRGEDLSDTIRRHIRDGLGLRIRVVKPYGVVRHAYSHFRVTVTAFDCFCQQGRPKPLDWAAARWVWPSHLKDYPLHKTSRRIGDHLLSAKEAS